MERAADAIRLLGSDRFEIHECLGRGASGEVYRAHDRQRGIEVAIKVLRGSDPTALYRFKQEFRALADVSHPNLVRLYELVSTDDLWFLTMELVDGINVLDFVRYGFAAGARLDQEPAPPAKVEREPAAVRADARPSGKGAGFDEPEYTDAGPTRVTEGWSDERDALVLRTPEQFERLRRAMRQLADGVDALHQAGRLHRDLKPSNILVDRDGRVVVLDFGVVAEVTGERQTARAPGSDAIVGTPAYMAPEQAEGSPLSPRTDWYTIGVILYEALCGRRPFGGALEQTLEARKRFEPTPPRRFAPSTPAELEDLCLALLAPRPADRPDNEEILRALRISRSTESASWQVLDATLIGRKRHLQTLHGVLDEVRRGEARTVLVHGRTGMGKTALVQRFLSEVESEGDAVVLAGRCYEHESVPFKALDPLIDALCRHLLSLSNSEVESVMPAHVWALARLFPVLHRVEAIVGRGRSAAEELEPVDLRNRAYAVLRSLLERLAERAPLVLHIDDLQWGDTDSAVVLERVLRPPSAPAIMLIASYRSEAARSSPFLRDWLSRLVDPLDVPVGPLTREQSEELASALLGQGNRAVPTIASSIARESGGSPFFLHELIRYVHAESFTELSLGTITLEEVVRARVDDLSPEARRLLEVLAVAGQPLAKATAQRAANLEREQTALAIASLRARNMLRDRSARPDALEVFHDRIREIAVAQLAPRALRAYHRDLAIALSTEPHPDPEALAGHFDAAGMGDRAAELHVEAAEHAMQTLAFDKAARLYARALELRGASGSDGSRLLAALAGALGNAGRGADASARYLEAAELAGPIDALEYRRLAAEYLLRVGHFDQGVDLLEKVLSDVGLELPRSSFSALLSLGYRRLRLWLGRMRFKKRDASELSPMEIRKLDISWSAAIGLAMVDTIRGADFQTRHLLLALSLGEPFRLARALAVEAGFASLEGQRGRARQQRILALAHPLIENHDAPAVKGWLHGVEGLGCYQRGEFREAFESCEKAQAILAAHGTSLFFEWTSIQLYSIWALYYLGNIGEIAARVPRALRESKERGDLYAVTNLSTGLAITAWLARDDVDGARAANRAAIARWSTRGFHLQHYWALLAQVQTDLYDGARDQTWSAVLKAWPGVRSFARHIELVRIEGNAFRGRAALACAAVGERDARQREAARSARLLVRSKTRYGPPQGQLIRAGLAAISGDSDSAVALLSAAEEGAAACDMQLIATVARRQRGLLLGGDEGRVMVEAADEWMRAQRIARPERLARMIAPGFAAE